jgi:hypothetical protein
MGRPKKVQSSTDTDGSERGGSIERVDECKSPICPRLHWPPREDGWMGLDAGPKTCALFRQSASDATKIFLNGPAGVFKVKPFDEGAKALVDILETKTKAGCVTVVGGGDSVAALEVFGKTQAVSHVSTGGGATLKLLAGDILPGVAAIADYGVRVKNSTRSKAPIVCSTTFMYYVHIPNISGEER